MEGGRIDEEWLSSTRPGGDACIVQLCGDPPRAVWKARGSELHRGLRTVLVFIRGSRRAGAGTSPPVCTCSGGTDGFHAYDERCRASTTKSTPTPTSTPFITTTTPTTNANTFTTVAIARTIWTRRWNVCRCRSVLSRFVRNGKTKRLSPHHSSTLILPIVRHSDGAVTSEGQALHTGSSVIHQVLKRKLKLRVEEGSTAEWAVGS